MEYQELMFAAAVQAAARVNRDRELAAWLADSHPDIRSQRFNEFQSMHPLEVSMVGAYREIMEAKQVIERLRKSELDALLSAQNQTPPPRPTTHVTP